VRRWPRLVLVITFVSLDAALVACSGDSGSNPGPVGTMGPTSAATTPPVVPTITFAQPGAATFHVIAGKAQGAMDIEQFMPRDIHIREGDSIEWAAQGIEGHTVTFAKDEDQLHAVLANYLVPDPEDPGSQLFNPQVALRSDTASTFSGDGSFVNSGYFGVPVEQTYRLTFTKRGVYQYLCLVHPLWMRGTVTVDAPDAQVESPDTVAARGEAQFADFLLEEQRALDRASAETRDLPGPDGTALHRVAVGLTTPYGQVATFVQPSLDIKAGDTVIFESDDRDFHNVVFKGAGDEPPGVSVRVDPQGRGINVSLDKRSAAAVDPPAGGFDDKTFLSSGTLGILMPRTTWRLTFDKPGTYTYSCTIHVLAGMAGVIHVSPR
jgi:plastocyanin